MYVFSINPELHLRHIDSEVHSKQPTAHYMHS